MACLTRVITLGPGEQFVIPADGEIVYVSDTTAVTSTNNCVNIKDNPSTYYRFRMPIRGSDVDGSEHQVIGIRLGENYINISPSYGGGLGTTVESESYESASNFVNRLANNLWNQLQSGLGLLIFGLRVQYTDADRSGGDIVEIFLRTIKVDGNPAIVLNDIDSQGVVILVEPRDNNSDGDGGQDNDAIRGSY